MTHAFLAHPQVARQILPLCASAIVAGGLFFRAHGQATTSHARSCVIPAINIQ